MNEKWTVCREPKLDLIHTIFSVIYCLKQTFNNNHEVQRSMMYDKTNYFYIGCLQKEHTCCIEIMWNIVA